MVLCSACPSVSEIPLSVLSELGPMERRDDPVIRGAMRTEFQPDPQISIPRLSPCHLHPSPMGTCTPAFGCFRNGREAPGCSYSISQTHTDVFKMRLLRGQKLSQCLKGIPYCRHIYTKYSSDGRLGALEDKSRV